MHAMRSVVVHGEYRVLCQFAFRGKAPHLRLGGLDVLIHVPRAARRQRHLQPRCSNEGAKVIYRDFARIRSRQLHAGVVRRILDHVERNVAEIALVADPVPAADARLAIPGEGIRKAYARAHIPIPRVPEFADRTVWREQHLRIPEPFEQVCPAAEVKIRIELRVAVVLHAEVLITQAVVEGESWRDLPAVLGIDGKIPVSVAARKRWRTDRESEGARRSLNDSS